MRPANNIQHHARLRVGPILILVGVIIAGTLVLSPARRASARAVAPSWTYTGSLNAARAVHTATLLPNGKVLVVGGRDFNPGGGVFNSVELYDSSTGMWTSTGNLNTGRFAHTATLLLNGKVLVVGGYDGSRPLNILNSAELYDPADGTWSFTGNLNTPRAGWHTATLLTNGNVLVVGGVVDNNGQIVLTNSAELYDPTTGTWTSTGSLKSSLSSTAMLLPNGKVLVFDWDDSAELYDPATGKWSITGNLSASRFDAYTATVLPNGKVLVAGGLVSDCIGGCGSNSAELYDPATGTWTSTGNLNLARDGHTAILLPSGNVLVFGGSTPGNSAELYDPATGTWSITASLNTARVAPTATLLSNGKVLVAGGNVSGGPGTLNSAELYDPGATSISQIDDTQFFVRQQYLDFLGREPDPLAAQWVNLINNCAPEDTSCDRIHVSEAFFKSPEFQQRGYFAYRFYSVSFGRKPDFAEFMPDLQRVSGFLTDEQLEAAKAAFVNDFTIRDQFMTKYNSLSNQSYVDTLLSTAGVTLSNRQALIDALNIGTATRAQVLRQIAESGEVYQRYYNQAFVVMQYFGYLRRDPDILYLEWIKVLDANPADSRHMIEGFVNSIEYRRRFGP